MIVADLLQLAGGLQLLQTPAIIAGQRSLGWTDELQVLTPLGRRFVYAIAAGVFCYVTGSGVLTVLFASELVSTNFGFGLCALQAIAWSARAGQQLFGMGSVWPKRGRWLHVAMKLVYTTLAFMYLAICVAVAATNWG